MNNTEYWKEVNETAENIISESTEYFEGDYDSPEEYINDTLLHETIDGHEWIIYSHNHLPILEHSPNDQYMVDNIGGLDESLKSGLDTLHCHLAFWAFYADVQEALYSIKQKQPVKL